MEKALKMKERQEAIEKEVGEIKARNFEAMKEKCRVDVAKKGERMDYLRRFHEERREALQEENIHRIENAGKLFSGKIDESERIAEEILARKRDAIAEEKHRQVIRDQNIELKELEAKVKSAYAARTAQIQIREREAKFDDEKYREKHAALMKSRWYNDDSIDRHLKDIERNKKSDYLRDIQDQLVRNQFLREERDEESYRERKIVEEVSGVIANENLELEFEKRNKMTRVQAEREAFLKARGIWKCKEKEALLDEFNREARIISEKITDQRNRALLRSNDTAARDAMMEKTARQMLDCEVKKEERQCILEELLVEEENEGVVKALESAARKKEILKRELLLEMKRQEQLIAERKTRSAEVDAAFGKYLSEQHEAASLKDREEFETRRRKGIKYGDDLRKISDERRALYVESVLLRQALLREEEKQELQRVEEISLERSKILQEHGPRLEGFLRPEILRPEGREYIETKGCHSKNF